MSDPNSADRANKVPWPPVLYLVVGVAAYGLERVWPLALPVESGVWAGWLIALLGFGIAASGGLYFQSIGTPIDPTGQAKKLAMGGIYAVTRNPMYLGALVFFTGLALALRSGWLLIFVPVVAIALQKLAIEREEAYLTRRFGEEYLAYCHKVRRWV